jgi:hypothetical protein
MSHVPDPAPTGSILTIAGQWLVDQVENSRLAPQPSMEELAAAALILASGRSILARRLDSAPGTWPKSPTVRLAGAAPAVRVLADENLPEPTSPDDGDDWAGEVKLILAHVTDEDTDAAAVIDVELQEIAEAALGHGAIAKFHLNGDAE